MRTATRVTILAEYAQWVIDHRRHVFAYCGGVWWLWSPSHWTPLTNHELSHELQRVAVQWAMNKGDDYETAAEDLLAEHYAIQVRRLLRPQVTVKRLVTPGCEPPAPPTESEQPQ